MEKHVELAAQSQFDCVGQVFRDTVVRGSCVFIGGRSVLTAAHLFIESDYVPRQDTIDGNLIVVNERTNHRLSESSEFTVRLANRAYKVSKITCAPGYLDHLPTGTYDLALIELEEPIVGITSPMINSKFDEMNSVVTGVGYGVVGHARQLGQYETNRKLAGQNVIDSFEGEIYNGIPTVMLCDFDEPGRPGNSLMGDSLPLDLEYLSSGGDSGGGLFRQQGDAWELVGICSGIQINLTEFMKTLSHYGQMMEWTRVSALVGWIEETMPDQ